MLGFVKISLNLGKFCGFFISKDNLVRALMDSYVYALVDVWPVVKPVALSDIWHKFVSICFKNRKRFETVLFFSCVWQMFSGSSKILSTRYGFVLAVIAGLISFSSKNCSLILFARLILTL